MTGTTLPAARSSFRKTKSFWSGWVIHAPFLGYPCHRSYIRGFCVSKGWGVVYASSWLNPILQDARGFLMAVAQRLPQGGRLPHERAGTQENAHRPCAPHARREAQGLIIKIPRIGSVFKQEFYDLNRRISGSPPQGLVVMRARIGARIEQEFYQMRIIIAQATDRSTPNPWPRREGIT